MSHAIKCWCISEIERARVERNEKSRVIIHFVGHSRRQIGPDISKIKIKNWRYLYPSGDTLTVFGSIAHLENSGSRGIFGNVYSRWPFLIGHTTCRRPSATF